MKCKKCGIEKKDEKLVLSILSKLGLEFSFFVSNFYSRRITTPNWRIPSLYSFSKSLIQEQDKLIQMGVPKASKNQALLVGDSGNV